MVHRQQRVARTRAVYGEDLAFVHHVGFREIPEAAARWLLRYLSAHRVPDGAIVDLASGSGIFAGAVAKTGRRVVGIDASTAMVALARRTAPLAHFQSRSLHDATLPTCAIVSAIGEGVSYVPPSDRLPSLTRTFGRVSRCLVPRGLFVFDAITGPIARLVPSRTGRVGPDWAVFSETRAARVRDRFERHIVTFRHVRGRYRRSDEVHVVQVYDRRRLAEALREAGFTVRSMTGYDRPASLPGRTVFVARKSRPRPE